MSNIQITTNNDNNNPQVAKKEDLDRSKIERIHRDGLAMHEECKDLTRSQLSSIRNKLRTKYDYLFKESNTTFKKIYEKQFDTTKFCFMIQCLKQCLNSNNVSLNDASEKAGSMLADEYITPLINKKK